MGRVAPRVGAPEGAALLDALLRGAPAGKRGALCALEAVTIRFARAAGLLDATPRTIAVDSTGYALTHCSAHYRSRTGGDHAVRGYAKLYAKLTVACDAATHLILAAAATKGPSYDSPLFGPVVRRAAARLGAVAARLGCVLADAGYDAERHHALCAALGADALIAVNLRGAARVRSPHRRRAHRRLARGPARRRYGQRWQVESCYSRQKRRTGDALRARRNAAQRTELLLRALTHNLLILLRRPVEAFQQSSVTRNA